MGDEYDYTLTFPIWVLATKEDPTQVVVFSSPTGECTVMMFTDEDLAARFIAKMPAPAPRPGARSLNSQEFEELLRAFRDSGRIQKVFIDPELKSGYEFTPARLLELIAQGQRLY
jgi:hypothetical protein